MMRIAIILGTRPEIIKMSPVIRGCEEQGLDYFILHTGQHYSYNLDKIFFEELELPGARYNLDVGSNGHGKQTGEMLIGIEKVLQEELPFHRGRPCLRLFVCTNRKGKGEFVKGRYKRR
jgi:UDP-N-acetylglucosamine 2-epimerase (non-hydrolysing)